MERGDGADSRDPAFSDPRDAAFARALLENVAHASRLSNTLPSNAQRSWANSFPEYSAAMNGLGNRLGGMMQGFVEQQNPGGAAAESRPPASYGNVDNVSDRFESVVDLSDRLLERVESDLDRQQHGVARASAEIALGETLETPQRRPPHPGPGLTPSGMSSGGGNSTLRPQNRWREEVRAQPRTRPAAMASAQRGCEDAMTASSTSSRRARPSPLFRRVTPFSPPRPFLPA